MLEDSLLHEIIYKLIVTMHKHRYTMERRLEETGVYQSQHRLLMEVSKNENSSQKMLAENMQVSTATVTVMLKKLEKGGFIQRLMDAEDNRIKNITLTSKGKKVVEKSAILFENMNQETFKGFTEDEARQLSNMLDRINDNLRNIGKD